MNIIKARAPAATIEALRGWAFVGSHAFDSAAFKVFYALVEDEAQPLAHRAEALHIACARGMGLTCAEMGAGNGYVPGASAGADAAFVQAYIDQM